MHIEINRDSKTPLYIQIKKQISSMIMSSILPANYVLPSERILSEELKVNRSTIIKAYMELKAEGLVESFVGKGTVILPQLSKNEVFSNTYIPPLRWSQFENRLFTKNNDQTISKILSVFEKDKIISFASGISSEDTCEFELLKTVQINMLKKYKEKLFLPTGVDGSQELKNIIKNLLKSRGIITSTKQLIVTSGSQQAIDFLGKLFIEPGDVVIVEEPTYPGAIQVFENYGARIVGIPMSEDGMKLDILESCLLKYRPKFIYTQPNFQNPSGMTMSLEKRRQLLKLAYYYEIPIFEDDPYSELRFEGKSIPSLKSLDNHDYVVYISTFSKTISFSLRVGFIAANENLINHFIKFKQLSDIQTNTQAQYLVAEFIKEGHYQSHINFLKASYKNKRDLMRNELMKGKIQDLEVYMPQGGYFIWCKLPDTIRLTELMENLAAHGVLIMPGEVFYPNGSIVESFIRLNYSYPTEEDIREGVKRILKAINSCSVSKRNSKLSLSSNLDPFL